MLEHWLLVPLGMVYLRILVYILVIAVVVQFTEMVVRKTNPALYQVLGIYLPLITTNCAVLGIPLLTTQEKLPFVNSLLYGFGSAAGFTLVLLLFAGLRERLALAQVPPAFAGAPIGFITASLLALTFMGFAGLVKVGWARFVPTRFAEIVSAWAQNACPPYLEIIRRKKCSSLSSV